MKRRYLKKFPNKYFFNQSGFLFQSFSLPLPPLVDIQMKTQSTTLIFAIKADYSTGLEYVNLRLGVFQIILRI